MRNTLAAYAEVGAKAGRAITEQDAARAESERRYFRAMLALELDSDKAAARQAYDTAYRAARPVPTVTPWR